jgi:hypothetical protein
MLLIGNVGYCHLRLFGCGGVNHIVLGNLWKSLHRQGEEPKDVQRVRFGSCLAC